VTSGAEGHVTGGGMYAFDKAESTPVTSHDWVSPTVGTSAGFSANRAQRMFQIHDKFSCPAAINEATLYVTQNPLDRSEFDQELLRRPFRQMSYFAPRSFHVYPSAIAASRHRYNGSSLPYEFPTPVQVNNNYVPRLDMVGFQPGAKVAVADGTRYFDPVIDVQIDTAPSLVGGSFLDPGPMFHRSRAFGRGEPTSFPENVQLSMRHGAGTTINAGFFDGHVGIIKKERIYEDPVPWFPSGSTFTGGSDSTVEARARWQVGDQIP
jgi:prepilin-type processing-associated H-X9-DG protein